MKTNTIPVFDNDLATMVYHADEKVVHHTFHQPTCGVDFRAVLETGIALLKKYDAHKWLADDRNNAAMSDEDTAWALEEWLLEAEEVGWEAWAIVLPSDAEARANYSEFVFDFLQQGIHMGVFDNTEEARDWLARF